MLKATANVVPQGWTPSPDGRGTIDIIWSCMFTIILCTWTVLCVNIGAPSDGRWRKFLQKAWLAFMCGLGPEFLVLLVIGQWASARESVAAFHSSGYPLWTMKHAFFTGMGGFILKTNDEQSWPLDAIELHYIITEGWVEESVVSSQIMVEKEVIEDKNKSDGFVRIITLCQTLWFVVNCIGRAVQHLTTTTLELTTLGFISTTVGVLYFWAHKPADISTPITLSIDLTMADIEGIPKVMESAPWHKTPLDFLHPESPNFSVCWNWHVNLLRNLCLISAKGARPIVRRADDEFPPVSDRGLYLVRFFALVCFALNIVAWNFWFPSPAERNLWRASSLALIMSCLIGFMYNLLMSAFLVKMKPRSCERWAQAQNRLVSHTADLKKQTTKERIVTKCRDIAHWLRNNSPEKDPAMTMGLRVLLLGIPCIILYSSARIYLLVEDVIVFRALPPDAYKTVNWSQYMPHI